MSIFGNVGNTSELLLNFYSFHRTIAGVKLIQSELKNKFFSEIRTFSSAGILYRIKIFHSLQIFLISRYRRKNIIRTMCVFNGLT